MSYSPVEVGKRNLKSRGFYEAMKHEKTGSI
jgi:hypothetical protein